MTKIVVKTKTKYIYGTGDQRNLYIIRGRITLRRHLTWLIKKVTYNKKKNYTSIKLIKIN
ncbi:MAG: hypothetical protein NUV47_01100 [Patescibacteria group bacterium]|nr:hypothetical protein [Patescibacteria group bacterium]